VADDDCEQAQVDPEHLGEGVAERDAGDDAGEGDRQHDQEGDRLAAEEAESRHCQGREGPEDEREQRRQAANLQRGDQGVARPLALDRPAEPVQGEVLGRPLQGRASVEGVNRNHDQRDVDEREGDPDTGTQQIL